MVQAKISIFLLFALFICTLAYGSGRPGQGQGQEQGYGGRAQMGRGMQGGHNYDSPMGRGGRQQYGGGEDDMRKYRSNLYNDDDVYGYDATYPNGEAAYINYKSKEARGRRGPEFARTSRAYSRSGGGAGGAERGYAAGKSQQQY